MVALRDGLRIGWGELSLTGREGPVITGAELDGAGPLAEVSGWCGVRLP